MANLVAPYGLVGAVSAFSLIGICLGWPYVAADDEKTIFNASYAHLIEQDSRTVDIYLVVQIWFFNRLSN